MVKEDKENDLYLTIGSIAIIFINFGILIHLAYRNGYITFLKNTHWWSLFLMVISGIGVWLSMVLVVNESSDKFNVTDKQWISFGVTILISFLYWCRFVFTVGNVVEESIEE